MSDSASRELQRLATLERNRGNEELRVSLDEYTDELGCAHRYISIRLWFKGDRGDYLPTKKGLTIRKGEIREVGNALRAGLDSINGSSGTDRAQSDNPYSRDNTQPMVPQARQARTEPLREGESIDDFGF